MIYFSKLKTAIIVAVCLLGVLVCIPNFVARPAAWIPWRTVGLGLDLRGGSYLLLEVDMAAVSKERLDSLADTARSTLRSKVQFQPPQVQPAQNRVLIRLRDPQQTDDASKLLTDALRDPAGAAPEYTVASTPGEISLGLSEAGLRARADAAILQSIEIVRRRIDETGVLDPQIARQGADRIVVQLPGVDDPNRIKELIGKTAKMTFRLVDDAANPTSPTPPPGDDFLPVEGQPGVKEAVRRRIEVDGANLTDARPGQDTQNNRWVVNFTFDSLGTRRFAETSTANVGKRFAIVLDDKVISAPVIREPITGGARPDQRQLHRRLGPGPFRAAPRGRVAGAPDGGRGTLGRAGVGRRQHPRRRHFARHRAAAGDGLHGVVLRPVRLVRERGPRVQPRPADRRAVVAGGDADAAGHGRHPADPRRGGRRQHPDQRARPRGGPPWSHSAQRARDRVPPGLRHHRRQQRHRLFWRM